MIKLPDKILVIVPHPDDEALMCAGIISHAVKSGREINVAIVTNGDYLCNDFSKGTVRLTESLNAMKSLGVKNENIHFLGYPDTGFEPEVSFINSLKESTDDTQIYPSACSDKTYALPNIKDDYSFLQNGEHSSYCTKCFNNDIISLISQIKPNLIITTSRWDMHADHSALSYFIQNSVDAVVKTDKDYCPQIWESIIHSPAGDDNWPKKREILSPLTMPPHFEEITNLKWNERISIPVPDNMSGEEENNVKYKLIKSYKTALNPSEPLVIEYLLAFAKQDEVFFKVYP